MLFIDCKSDLKQFKGENKWNYSLPGKLERDERPGNSLKVLTVHMPTEVTAFYPLKLWLYG